MSADSLETRIASALRSDDVKSNDLAALISETEAAITAATKDAESERAKALDPTELVDVQQASIAVTTAEFTRDRLTAALPQLRARYQQVSDQETYDRWVDNFERVKPKHEAVVERLKSIYLDFGGKLLKALVEAAQVDAEVHEIMQRKPYLLPQTNGDGKNLPTVELAARGLDGVAPGCSLMKDFTLPYFNEPDKLAWPPRQPPLFASMFVPVMPHLGADWWAYNQVRDRERREESEKIMSFYKQQQEERERGEAAEAQAARDEARRQRGYPP